MSDESTRRMIESYMESMSAPMFLSSFFRTPQENFHSSEKVEIDVIREDGSIALPVSKVGDSRKVEMTKATNKGFTPPVIDLVVPIDAVEMLKREPGTTGFDNVFNDGRMRSKAVRALNKIERMIRGTVELMCSQVLQTGTITLADASGTIYSEDFKPKTAHIATVSTVWADNGSTGTPISDLAALCDLVRRNGRVSPNKLIFGATALRKFLANAEVQNLLFRDRYNAGELRPVVQSDGATKMGNVWVGSYGMEIWAYTGFYYDPVTSANKPFLADDKVIIISDQTRLDMTYGDVPLVAPPDARAAAFLPPRMSDTSSRFDMSVNAWVEPNGRILSVGGATRPLPIPTAIDGFACLDVVP